MWLVGVLALIGLALVLLVVFGVHAFSRFRRMSRFGSRATGRLSELADRAGQLGDRIDGLNDEAEALADRAQAQRDRAEREQPSLQPAVAVRTARGRDRRRVQEVLAASRSPQEADGR